MGYISISMSISVSIKEIYYEELAPTIMEAEKFYHMPSARWKPKKDSGVIQSESKSLKTGEAAKNPSPKAEDEMSQC